LKHEKPESIFNNFHFNQTLRLHNEGGFDTACAKSNGNA